jgi:hypothetical protein
LLNNFFGSRVAKSADSCKAVDEGIPTSLPSSIHDIAGRVDVQHKPNDLRTGPITRARAKLLEQQVNSDESILTSLPSSVDDIAGCVDVQHKPDNLRTGPIIRACAKLLEQ